MKKKITAITTLICFLFVAFFDTISLAWMSDNGMSSPIDITSNVHKSYFESGDGTKDIVRDESGDIISGPFEIASPLQFYYFAWLQYLGFFNEDTNQDGKINTVYFRLSKDIDMSYVSVDGEQITYVLPPIGTVDNPFLGNFDGEGHTITDLTVENTYDSLYEAPEDTNKDTYGSTAEIIGCFGVIGQITEVDYTYNSQANEVKNLIINNITIKTQTNNALIGAVAGYVNGIVDCVGVVGATINAKSGTNALTYTSNLSDYALIGYCTDAYKDSVYVFGSTLTAPGTTDSYTVVPEVGGNGNSPGWGGSVKMSDIVTWLTTVMGNRVSSTNNNYITERTDCVTLDGTTVTTGTVEDTIATYTVDGFGSFIGSTMNWNNNPINFLGGAQKVTQYQYRLTEEDVDVYYIKDGNYYLCFDGNNIYSTQNQAEATTWYASNGTNGGAISTVIGKRVYYLTITNGAVATISDVNADPGNLPTWSNSDNGYLLNGQRIRCDNGTWIIDTDLKISYNNNYLTNNGTTGITNTTNLNSAVSWRISAVNDGYQISTVINNRTYYLGYTQSSNGWQTTVSGPTLSTNATTWQKTDTNQFYVSVRNMWGSTNYYLRYNNGWTVSNSTNNSQLTFHYTTNNNVSITLSGEKAQKIICEQKISVDNSLINGYYDANGNKVEENRPAGITYFPLSTTVTMGNNANQDSYSIDSTNTGYIIGAEWGVNDGTLSEHDADGANIRISRYGANSMGENASTPYTMTYKTNGKFQKISDRESSTLSTLGLQKFADCYNDYYSSIQGGCSGLHFMEASVSTSNMTRITATLKGETYDNYQVPTNCIDFNLYERGFINFVAGSYYTQGGGNNSFFSLYEIVRYPDDEKSIKEIKEICKIYAQVTNGTIDTSKAYYYTYFDKNRAETGTAGIPEGYQMVFDSQWITHPNTGSYFGASDGPSAWDTDQAYYFEVPVNAGEYAIGSTKGRTGAYLVYLDLAANAQLIDRTKQHEEITEILTGATIPNGVDLLAPVEGGYTLESLKENIDPAGSAFVSIGTTASGDIILSKQDNEITVSTTTGITAEYVSTDTVLQDKNGNILTVPITKTTKIERTTYRDYNRVTGDYTVTVITTTTVTENGKSTVSYTRQITTTNSAGEVTTGEVEPFDELPTPETPDSKADIPTASVGAKLIDLAFAYGQEVDLTISYLYTPAGEDAEGNATPPTYLITITNPGTEEITLKAILTAEGVSSGITFIITDGTTETTLTNNTTAQTVVIATAPAEQPTEPDQPADPEEPTA